jgi:hypothetical protein
MADPVDDIRKLKFPPTPAWGGNGPSTKTLREDISRFYEPAGGIDRAIEAANLAMQQTDDPFRKWDTRNLDVQVPVVMAPLDPRVNGQYSPKTRRITLNSDSVPTQNSIEHERSHAAFGPDQLPEQALAQEESKYAGQRNTKYISSPQEIDVRLANIKRHYAYNTGKIVTTPEEALEAIKWWGRNSDDFNDQAPEREQPAFRPQAEAGTYLLLPEEERNKVLRRMPELVNSDLIERLGQYG